MYTVNPESYLQKVETKGPSDKSLNRIEKEHELKVQDLQLENELLEKSWKCCSFDLHPESSLFFGKLTVSCMVIGLCTYQLVNLKDCNYQSLYSSLLSSVITFWLTKKWSAPLVSLVQST